MLPASPVGDFQTPARILIPKLVRSRDAWKAKATQRKKDRKALQIRVRDLIASRDRHRQRAQTLNEALEVARLQLDHAQQQLQQMQHQLQQTQQEREQLQARLDSVAALGAAVLPVSATGVTDTEKKTPT
jgi:chromosome segregation ATPase